MRFKNYMHYNKSRTSSCLFTHGNLQRRSAGPLDGPHVPSASPSTVLGSTSGGGRCDEFGSTHEEGGGGQISESEAREV
jgi:hypothetical protein